MKIFKGLLLTAFLYMSCGMPEDKTKTAAMIASNTETKASIAGSAQTMVLTVDGNKQVIGSQDITTMNFVRGNYLSLAVMSESKDLQLAITTGMTTLSPGTYEIFSCKGPSECDQAMEDKKQSVLFAPYPKDPMPAVSTSRIAYKAPALNLAPLTLVIESITDEQLEGSPWKTKKIKGHFKGILAYVERPVQDWQIIGKTTTIEGSFDLYCMLML